MTHRYEVHYSWPATHHRLGQDWPTTAHGGFVADFAGPVTEDDWPVLAEIVQRDRPDIGSVTITSVTEA